jgi:aminopeptidase N
MKWDEDTYGLEYDLDIYMIVSVHSFNAGAMENKGLNIFNSKYVLANPNTATDDEYEAIQGVIGHEYFHNWSGNRVTCRDWFQLSLKEGLTVYRDQEFTSDMTSRPVKRINDVNMLRTNQFAEDSGPMAHPVRPASYISVNNFYTLTVYEKGSEVVRMIHTIIGDESFKKGLTEYFNRFDGQAVTTDDFVLVMEEVSGVDLKQFKNWYSQAGTPEVEVTWNLDESTKVLNLKMKQSSKPSPNQSSKESYHIPVQTAFFDELGNQLEFEVSGTKYTEKVFHLNQPEQSYKIKGLPKGVKPSILRNFSAPVNVKTDLSEQALCFLFAKDTDQFNRWDSGQKLSLKYILNNVKNLGVSKEQTVPDFYLNSFESILNDKTIDPSFKSQLLIVPDETYINQFVEEIDPFVIFEAREFLRKKIATQYRDDLLEIYTQLYKETPNTIDPQAISNRKLKNSVLSLLGSLNDNEIHDIAMNQYETAKNMTDRLSALAYLNQISGDQRENAMADFYSQFSNDTLTMDKWFTLHATSELPNGLERIKKVMEDPTFDIKTPNKVYSLLYRFGRLNTKNFHSPSGESYEFYRDQILKIDRLNPQVASRLTGVFNLWKRYEPKRRELIKSQLEVIIKEDGLSSNVFEIASKALN